MGVIISVIALVTNSTKNKRDKKKANKIRPADESQPRSHQVEPQQGVEDPVQQALVGLTEEHLATTSPLHVHEPGADFTTTTTGAQIGVEVLEIEGSDSTTAGRDRVGAELATTTNSKSTTTVPANPTTTITKGVEKNTGADMASDEDYAAFLEQANRDPNEGVSEAQSSSGKVDLKTVDQDVKVPAVLEEAVKEAFYVSDADEPFVSVCLKLPGKGKTKLPDEATFAKLVHHPDPKKAEVSIIDIGEWDPRGQYKDVVGAVKEASKGSDVRVYRIVRGGTRVEYWVVGIEDGKLVGVKALAIES